VLEHTVLELGIPEAFDPVLDKLARIAELVGNREPFAGDMRC
jgi:hypothetical protein